MTQPTIGQRLWELWNGYETTPELYVDYTSESMRSDHQRIATELLRGVLTGEIPLPEELVKAGYFVGHLKPEMIETMTFDHISDASK